MVLRRPAERHLARARVAQIRDPLLAITQTQAPADGIGAARYSVASMATGYDSVWAMPGWRIHKGSSIIPAGMRPPAPPEIALCAFFEEHRRCGQLDGGVEDERLWMTCECGAALARSLDEKRTAR